MLVYILYTIFFLSCIVLIATVLLQPGKTDAGALFTSNVSSSSFGPRGTATVLSKMTIAAATVFMLTALMISMPAVTGSRSVLQGSADTPAETTTEPNPMEPTGNTQVPITDPPAPGTSLDNSANANAPAPPANQ